MVNVNKVGIFISVFIVIILGIVLLDTTADQVWVASSGEYTATDEAMTLNNVTAQSLTNDWVTAVSSIKANTNGTHNTTLNIDEYTTANLNDDDPATVLLVNDSRNGNFSFVTYNYQDDNYVRDGSSRTLISLVVIFFALAILGIAIAAMYRMGIFEIMK